MKKIYAFLLSLVLVVSMVGCEERDITTTNPIFPSGTGSGIDTSDDFQKNLHQADELSFIETDTGYYFSYGSLFYIEKETMTATRVCAKPDCDHTDPDICNSRIRANYLLTGGEKIYYVGYVNSSTDPKQVKSVKYDATEREVIQELKFRETSAAVSCDDRAIYHRGYIYYVSDDIVYRVKLGGKKDSAEEIWKPENAGTTQSNNGMVEFNPNAIRYTLWADGDSLYFMANVQTNDGTYKDVLFHCDLSDLSVQQVWATPGKDEVGAWETTGVKVSQWYVTNGYIYFYLSGGDMWRTELSSGKTEKLADTHEQTTYGSAIFSDDYMCLLNDIPIYFYGDPTPMPGAMLRSYGDTIFIYAIDGTFVKEISLSSLFDDSADMAQIDMICCSGNDIFFLFTAKYAAEGSGLVIATTKSGPTYLCHANIETGAVEILYTLKNG